VQTLFGDERPDFWAIHPGGRAIVDRLAQIFALGDADVAASREILRQYGNLSSATILFVLEELGRTLQQQNAVAGQPATGVAMAFGPGLVIEMARLTYTPVAQPALATAPLAAMVAHAPMSNGRERIYG
jgi:predicted naringenin-chalcone synthase